MGNRKNLMVVMAGDNSLHEANIAPERDFDIWVVYYGDNDEIADKYRKSADRLWRAKGLKLELARQILLNKVWLEEKFDFAQYEYIFWPDDDIKFPNGVDDVNRFLEIGNILKVDSMQPAIINEYFYWPPTKLVDGIFAHQVTWPEIMMPAYRGEWFAKAILPTLHVVDFWTSGHGFETYINRLIHGLKGSAPINLVIDETAANHTRPIGNNPKIHGQGRFEVFMVPQFRWYPDMITLAEFKTIADFNPVTNEIKDGIAAKRQKALDEYRFIFDRRKKILRWFKRKRRFKDFWAKLKNKQVK